MASRSTQRSRWILFHFFVLFGASYALGVLFLHITVSLCKDKVRKHKSRITPHELSQVTVCF